MTDYTKDAHALPFPEGGNKVAVHGDIQALATKAGIAITAEGARAVEAAGVAVGSNPKIIEIETVTIPSALSDAKTYANTEVGKDRERLTSIETVTIPAAMENARAHTDSEVGKDRERLGSIETVTIPKVLTDAKTYTDGATSGSSTKPINLDGSEDVKALGNAEYRVGTSTAAIALGLPTSGHGFLTVGRNSASGRVEWRDISPTDPATWVLQLAGGEWSEWRRTDGLKALSDAKTYADEVKATAIDASLGPKVISYDTATRRPYWDATTGTHRVFVNYEGRPYAALTPDITTTTPSGRPALDL